MTLLEALVVVGLVGVMVMAMGTLTSGALRARAAVEQDVVGGYAMDGFLEEASARPGRVPPPFAPVRLGRLRWVRRWLAGQPGPLVERRLAGQNGRTLVRVRFDGRMPRVLEGTVSLRGPTPVAAPRAPRDVVPQVVPGSAPDELSQVTPGAES